MGLGVDVWWPSSTTTRKGEGSVVFGVVETQYGRLATTREKLDVRMKWLVRAKKPCPMFGPLI